LDKTHVQLGSNIIDERLHQTITLRNTGGLGTNYRLLKSRFNRLEQEKSEKSENNQKLTNTSSISASISDKATTSTVKTIGK
jgi:ribosomal protein S2